uniref:Uncharacterized protein n=1 Tax=Oryza nivara TaxID=4536 RepID=A0A0E0HM48_ORYNI
MGLKARLDGGDTLCLVVLPLRRRRGREESGAAAAAHRPPEVKPAAAMLSRISQLGARIPRENRAAGKLPSSTTSYYRGHVQHSTLNSGLGPQVRRVGRCGREDRGARGSCVTCIGHSKPNPPQLGATV